MSIPVTYSVSRRWQHLRHTEEILSWEAIFFFPGHIWQHPMNGKSLFSWQSEVNIYAVWVNNPRTAAHHATFAFDLKCTGVKEKYTQFMKGIAICKSKLRTTPLPFHCLLLILQMPWFSPYGLMPRENFFLIGTEENAPFCTPLEGSSRPESL